MKTLSLALLMTSLFSLSAQADICGIVRTHEFELVKGLVTAQMAQSPSGVAVIRSQDGKEVYNVKQVKRGYEATRLPEGVYYDLILKTSSGKEVTVDIGYMYLVTADGKNALNLGKLTACGVHQFAGPAVIQVKAPARASTRSIHGRR